MTGQEQRKAIEAWANEEGLRVGFAPVEADLKAEYFRRWIAEGRHAQMEWMDNPRRTAPPMVLPECRTIVVLALNYHQEPPARQGQIARYALGADYHGLLLKKLKRLCALLREWGGEQKPYVDTGPILEKRFAAATALGWQGKNTVLVSPTLGTWSFLGVVLTTLELPTDKPSPNRCGRCTRCMTACPTRAITAPHELDARRCIAYLTIEHAGVIAEEFEEAIGDQLFGCDECLAVCPWNRFARATREAKLQARAYPSAREMLTLNEARFAEIFAGTPLKRTGLLRLQRNACIVLGNLRDENALPALRKLADASSDEAVRHHARRAIQKMGSVR